MADAIDRARRKRRCPQCGGPMRILHTQVKEGRKHQTIRRRVLCEACGYIMWTAERPE